MHEKHDGKDMKAIHAYTSALHVFYAHAKLMYNNYNNYMIMIHDQAGDDDQIVVYAVTVNIYRQNYQQNLMSNTKYIAKI